MLVVMEEITGASNSRGSMQIQRVVAKNFYSYEHLDLALEDLGLVLVEGENRDDGGSNGAGKSTIFDSITWGLFGWTPRYGKSGKDVVREDDEGNGVGDCQVYLRLEVDGSTVEIFRHQDHSEYGNKLMLLVDGNELSMGSGTETQKRIDKLLQLDLETFRTVVVFPQDAVGFASLNDAEQKSILERVLGIGRFAKAQELAKNEVTLRENKISELQSSLTSKEATLAETKLQNSRLHKSHQEFEEKQKTLVERLDKELQQFRMEKPLVDLMLIAQKSDIQKALDGLDASSVIDLRNTATHQLEISKKERNEKGGVLESKLRELGDWVDAIPVEPFLTLDDAQNAQQVALADLQYCQRQKRDIEQNWGSKLEQQRTSETVSTCHICGQYLSDAAKLKLFGEVEKEAAKLKDKVEDIKAIITAKIQVVTAAERDVSIANAWKEYHKKASIRKEMLELNALTSAFDAKINTLQNVLNQSEDLIREYNELQGQLKDVETQLESQKVAYTNWTNLYNTKLTTYTEETQRTSPVATLIADNEASILKQDAEILGLSKALEEVEGELPFYQFWVTGFGNQGVKSLVLDSVTDTLNTNANMYMKYLRENAEIEFSTQTTLASGEKRDKFSVQVKCGSTCKYKGTSGGEGTRADISIMFGLGDLASNRALASVDLRLLDEPFESLDALGKEQVVNLLNAEIVPKTKTVLVMTHDESLKQYFNKRILVIKENGISRIQL